MEAKSKIRAQLEALVEEFGDLIAVSAKLDDFLEFGKRYQNWYSRAIPVCNLLGKDRLEEFVAYYLIDPKRKILSHSNYVIQDYIKGTSARTGAYDKPLWDIHNTLQIRIYAQTQILRSLLTRIDTVLADVEGHLYADLQDQELEEAQKLVKANLRAAGAIAGVVLERHLQRVAENHGVTIGKKSPTISDINDPLKNTGVYDIPIWRKIQLLADIRNLCTHNKGREPTVEQVGELLRGVGAIIKTVF